MDQPGRAQGTGLAGHEVADLPEWLLGLRRPDGMIVVSRGLTDDDRAEVVAALESGPSEG